MIDEDTPLPLDEYERQPYAGFISRAAAFVIDNIIIVVSTSVGILVTSATLNALFPTHKELSVPPLLYASILYGVFVAYFALFWTFTATTPAMYLFGLRVTRMRGQRIGFIRSVVRVLCFGISAFCFGLGYLWVIVDKRHQAWHDKIARTVVPYATPAVLKPIPEESEEAAG